jgi:hypothetical protein
MNNRFNAIDGTRSSARLRPSHHATENKKTDVAEHPRVFDHVGLLFNRHPGFAGSPFV